MSFRAELLLPSADPIVPQLGLMAWQPVTRSTGVVYDFATRDEAHDVIANFYPDLAWTRKRVVEVTS